MNRKAKTIILGGTATLTLLMATSISPLGQESAPPPPVAPVLACTAEDRVIPPRKPQTAPVGEKTANVEPHNIPTKENDSEPPQLSSAPVILTTTEPPMDKPIPTPETTQSPPSQVPAEPQMRDMRIINGQKQSYLLGFGWIDDNDTPNEVYYAADMYENGNKIGIMGSNGDINKMVGTMD